MPNLIDLPLHEVQTSVGYIPGGLSQEEARLRLVKYGYNQVAGEKRSSSWRRLWTNVKNPLVILLSILSIISLLTGDVRSTVVILAMIILGIILRYAQEMRADKSAEKLKAMVSTHATVCRDGRNMEIPLRMLVPGDTIQLASGDMVPADVRLLSAKDLFLNQAVLTGESMPVEKTALPETVSTGNHLDACNACFLGSNVESGTATALVVHTGGKTTFGSLASHVVTQRVATSFDKGIDRFTWLMIRFIMIMVPVVFLINGFSRHNWLEAFLFAMAVAVGLTPEMLPMIVTVNLSKGALAMARKKVIVKKLNAIQNFGAMDVLCTDKTGTLTQGKIVLEQYLDPNGRACRKVLDYAYLNSYHHTGLKNIMDQAILDHEELEAGLGAAEKFRKIDEVPFDFVRKRMSVIVEDNTGLNTLICKGAVEGLMELCSHAEIDGVVVDMSAERRFKSAEKARALNAQGFRVVALAYKNMPGAPDMPVYSVKDEADLILLGFLSFLDPPKDSATEALQRLAALKVDIKILTGDNEIITTYICNKVGVPAGQVLQGPEIEKMTADELAEAVMNYSVFARLAPMHKQRIIRALQQKGHVTGFMGDGINDAPALKAADVGISVNSAVDIAKESSDIILLENSLLVLEQGVKEGRRVFGNIVKYIKMAASSNFGNMLSVVGASAFLPFLPMLPIQVLTNNLLYDFSQTAIPTDNVDADWLVKPRKWSITEIRRFILFIGPVSSIFDYITFFVLWHFFDAGNNPALFRTGWFVESVFTQTLVIHIIRTGRIPFIQSRASWPLILTSILVALAGAFLPFSPLAPALGFVPLPGLYWWWLAGILAGYIILTQFVKA
ncbi:MAG TPA: magnesium-translocating P-type ATPase, partial [Chitinophagaceae bacterium]|nr:magnesium-translocating P-type ATPase [Chitinophagaceae bacterium]